MYVAHGGVNRSGVGDGRGTSLERRGGGGDGLFLAGRSFVEDITITRLVIPGYDVR